MAMSWALSQQQYGLAQDRAGGGGGGGADYGLGIDRLEFDKEKFAAQQGLAEKRFGLQERQAFPFDYAADAYGDAYPGLVGSLYGKMRGEETEHRDWLTNLMRGTTSQAMGNLGKSLGGHLSRTNVAVPGGADMLARRQLSPFTQQMEMLMGLARKPVGNFAGRMGSAMNLGMMMAPFGGDAGQWGVGGYGNNMGMSGYGKKRRQGGYGGNWGGGGY